MLFGEMSWHWGVAAGNAAEAEAVSSSLKTHDVSPFDFYF